MTKTRRNLRGGDIYFVCRRDKHGCSHAFACNSCPLQCAVCQHFDNADVHTFSIPFLGCQKDSAESVPGPHLQRHSGCDIRAITISSKVASESGFFFFFFPQHIHLFPNCLRGQVDKLKCLMFTDFHGTLKVSQPRKMEG